MKLSLKIKAKKPSKLVKPSIFLIFGLLDVTIKISIMFFFLGLGLYTIITNNHLIIDSQDMLIKIFTNGVEYEEPKLAMASIFGELDFIEKLIIKLIPYGYLLTGFLLIYLSIIFILTALDRKFSRPLFANLRLILKYQPWKIQNKYKNAPNNRDHKDLYDEDRGFLKYL